MCSRACGGTPTLHDDPLKGLFFLEAVTEHAGPQRVAEMRGRGSGTRRKRSDLHDNLLRGRQKLSFHALVARVHEVQ